MKRRIIITNNDSNKNIIKSNSKSLKQYYVYLLIDPRNDKIFYVGKGTEDRLFQHSKEVKRGYVETEKQKILKAQQNA